MEHIAKINKDVIVIDNEQGRADKGRPNEPKHRSANDSHQGIPGPGGARQGTQTADPASYAGLHRDKNRFKHVHVKITEIKRINQ